MLCGDLVPFGHKGALDVTDCDTPPVQETMPFRASTGPWWTNFECGQQEKSFRDCAWVREVAIGIPCPCDYSSLPVSSSVLCFLADDRGWWHTQWLLGVQTSLGRGHWIVSACEQEAPTIISPEDALESHKEAMPVPSWLSHIHVHAHTCTHTHTHIFIFGNPTQPNSLSTNDWGWYFLMTSPLEKEENCLHFHRLLHFRREVKTVIGQKELGMRLIS